MVISNMCFFAAFYLLQDGGSELLCSDGGGDPLHALLEGALGQQVFFYLIYFEIRYLTAITFDVTRITIQANNTN